MSQICVYIYIYTVNIITDELQSGSEATNSFRPDSKENDAREQEIRVSNASNHGSKSQYKYMLQTMTD